ncbi:DUF58 domain-containing protein [Pelagicoccus sp. SDUM812002]|uniref:DUF58 domain-containing protein n=1 Tax=Pelagicoccus sp. SDUM812002 TaxID=3041266 RepID=UPI00280DBD7C|nr:DUF58 domain-containing protein [Pelagicoccus sp. SDUM812002]MDQ8184042.1 DUF58 domain-containing protein [Pelagicoccus sp. SDUM812002]
MPQSATSIDPEALLAIRDLELRARIVVDGLWSGLHRSPYHGFSVEFSEYRQYSPGDDLRYLDWKALARTDREYLKIFEDETNLRCTIALDSSKSMNFASGVYPKTEYAKTLAATLSYFLLQQRDIVGLARFDEDVNNYLPARWRPGHLKRVFALLEQASQGLSTNIEKSLQSIGRLCRKRGLVILISDFLSDPEQWHQSLAHLTAMGHDVRALQVLDPAEVNLDFGKPAYWEDIESGETLYVDPESLKSRYQDRFASRQSRLLEVFRSAGVRHQTITTDQALDQSLLDFVRNLRGANRSRP